MSILRRSKEIILPSSIKNEEGEFVSGPKGVTIQEWMTEEEDVLSDTKKLKSGQAINEVLEQTVVEAKENPDNWDFDKMLVGDRTFIMLQEKILSHGPEYEFTSQCPKCKETEEYTVDLSELEVQHLKSDKEEFVEEIEGYKVYYRLMKGKDVKRLQTLQKNNSDTLMTSYMILRTTKIEDPEGNPVNKRDFFPIPSRLAGKLRSAMDENDCGVDTTIKIDCSNPRCLYEYEQELPMGKNFYLPE